MTLRQRRACRRHLVGNHRRDAVALLVLLPLHRDGQVKLLRCGRRLVFLPLGVPVRLLQLFDHGLTRLLGMLDHLLCQGLVLVVSSLAGDQARNDLRVLLFTLRLGVLLRLPGRLDVAQQGLRQLCVLLVLLVAGAGIRLVAVPLLVLLQHLLAGLLHLLGGVGLLLLPPLELVQLLHPHVLLLELFRRLLERLVLGRARGRGLLRRRRSRDAFETDPVEEDDALLILRDGNRVPALEGELDRLGQLRGAGAPDPLGVPVHRNLAVLAAQQVAEVQGHRARAFDAQRHSAYAAVLEAPVRVRRRKQPVHAWLERVLVRPPELPACLLHAALARKVVQHERVPAPVDTGLRVLVESLELAGCLGRRDDRLRLEDARLCEQDATNGGGGSAYPKRRLDIPAPPRCCQRRQGSGVSRRARRRRRQRLEAHGSRGGEHVLAAIGRLEAMGVEERRHPESSVA
mmetsp:Transcript_75921/g.212844  ORF Transcript_75921/g.212844 Transcript_75921/m.212844 type:complete len:458 (+) Transcript_75921:1142-2515(+)